MKLGMNNPWDPGCDMGKIRLYFAIAQRSPLGDAVGLDATYEYRVRGYVEAM